MISKIFLITLSMVFVVTLSGCFNRKEAGLVLHYPFDETEGESTEERVAKDDHHVNYVFNEQNQPFLYQEARDPQWRENGLVGGALRFDGYSTYIRNETFSMPTEAFTISAWVAPHAFEWGHGGKLSAFVSQSNFARNEGMTFGMYRHGEWGIRLGVGGSLVQTTLTIMVDEADYLKPNEWHHVAVTFDQNTIKLYLNGDVVKTHDMADYSGLSMRKAPGEDLMIGRHSRPNKVANFDTNMFNGLMDDFKIYDQALDADTLAANAKQDLDAHGGTIPSIAFDDIQPQQSWYDDDRNRPQFHAMPNGMWMNEPHAPFYFNGKYHLFYQHNPFGPFWGQIHWGHWVSDDMVHWEDVGVAIRPHLPVTPDGVWSGSAHYDADGNPVLFITAGDDSKTPNQAVAVCYPADLDDPYLKEWDCDDEPAIEQTSGIGKLGEFRDPFVFKVDDVYYMLITSGTTNNNGGTALVYSSTDLVNYDYHGEFYVSDYSAYPELGLNWELPVFLPLKDENGNETDKWIFLISPHPVSLANVEVYYWIGEFDEETVRFVPDHDEPRLMDKGGNVFTGPSGFVDPVTGRSILFTIAQGVGANSWQEYYSGWAHSTGMPVSLWYNSVEEVLNFAPIEELANARGETLVNAQDISFDEANALLSEVGGDLLEIILEVETDMMGEFVLNVRESLTERTRIRYDALESVLIFNSIQSSENTIGYQRVADVEVKDGVVRIRLILDRSLVELYANDAVSITSRIYPVNGNSMGLSLFALRGEMRIRNIEVYRMNSIYNDPTVPGYYPE